MPTHTAARTEEPTVDIDVDSDLLRDLLAMPSPCEDPRSIHAHIQAAADIIAEHRDSWPDLTDVDPL